MRILLVLLLSLFIGCTKVVQTPPTSNILLNTKGYQAFWNEDQLPLKLVVPDNLDEDRLADIRLAMRKWEDAVGTPVFYLYTLPADDPLMLDLKHKYGWNVLVFAPLPKNPRIVLGECNRWTDHSGRLQYNYCEIEETLDPVKRRATMIKVLTHEMGHMLGLAHDKDKLSVMYGGNINHSLGLIEARDAKHILYMMEGLGYPRKFEEGEGDETVQSTDCFGD